MAKGKPRDRSKEAFWRKTMHRHGQSGLSVREFCRREKLQEPIFYSWRRELIRRDAEARLVRRSLGEGGPSKRDRRKTLFMPVRLAPDPATSLTPTESAPAPGVIGGGWIEIELAPVRRIHVAPPVDRQALSEVLAVLEGRPC